MNITLKVLMSANCLPQVRLALGVWQYRQSISIIQQLVSNRMFPLTLKGLEDAMRMLSK